MTIRISDRAFAVRSALSIFAPVFKGAPIVAFDPNSEGGTGGEGGDNAPKGDEGGSGNTLSDPPADPPKGDEGGKKPSETEAKLLKESMKRKERIEALEKELDKFKGIDVEEVKKLTEERKAADKAKRDAEKKAAEAAGDVDRVKQMMAEEHRKEVEALNAQQEEIKTLLSKRESQINDLTIGQAFANSNLIKDELVLTPAKARAIYGQHFEHEDGKVVAYDKPAGHPERTKLVDSKGENLSFEAALKKLVDADPDRESIVRSKLAQGANSKTNTNAKPATQESSEVRGVSRISAILAANGGLKAPGK